MRKQNDENHNFFYPKLRFLYNEMGQPIDFHEPIISIWRFPNPLFFGQQTLHLHTAPPFALNYILGLRNCTSDTTHFTKVIQPQQNPL